MSGHTPMWRMVNDAVRVGAGLSVVLRGAARQQTQSIVKQACLFGRNNLPSRHQIPQNVQQAMHQTSATFQSFANRERPPSASTYPAGPSTSSDSVANAAVSSGSSDAKFSEIDAHFSVGSTPGVHTVTSSTSEASETFSSASVHSNAFSSAPASETISSEQLQTPVTPMSESTASVHANLSDTQSQSTSHSTREKRKPLIPASATAERRRPATSRERRVPSHPVERAAGFGSLAIGMVAGAATESLRRMASGQELSKTAFLSEANASRLVSSLCRMRGAALKVGQMISLQEELLPKEIQDVLARVRDGADIMPRRQLESLLAAELGTDWEKRILDFDYEPLASASIGQVHRARLSTGEPVALKIQYPGVARSINSDLSNLQWLIEKFDLFPRGIYMDRVIEAARVELGREVDYESEGKRQVRMRELLKDTPGLNVPKVYDEFKTSNILVTDLVAGKPLDQLLHLPQERRNRIATDMLDLTLKELFLYRFMQTDPNWSNFLYDELNDVVHLIDFGAARDFRRTFTNRYLELVNAAKAEDADVIMKNSDFLGFTTGDETERLRRLHIESAIMLGAPFRADPAYDFSKDNLITSLSSTGAEIMQDRLTPPPQEAYSLHRKLTGCFLTCIKLQATVPCKKLFEEVYEESMRMQATEEPESVESADKYDGEK